MSVGAAAGQHDVAERRRSWHGVRVRREHRVEVAVGVAFVVVGSVIPFALGDTYWQQVMVLMDLYIGGAVFLNILRGEAGQISFGLAAVFGAAAYAEAMLATIYGIPLWLAVLLGIVIGCVFGTVTALPALRVQSYYLGFITLAVAVVLPAMLINYNGFTQAVSGITVQIPGRFSTTLWGLNWVAIVVIVLAALSFVVHAGIRSSRLGRHLKVVADSAEASASLGMRPGVLRLGAFAVASLGASVFGVLYVSATGFISPGAFPFTLSILFYFAVIVGGAGSILGPLLGIYLLYLVPNVVLSGLVEYRLLIYGCIAFVVMMIFPDGIVGFLRTRFSRADKLDEDLGIQLADSMIVPVQRGQERTNSPAGRSEEPPDTTVTPRNAPVLTVSGASKSFGSVHALDGVELRVYPGRIHGLVGANGSGKTTLLNAISGLITLDRGSVHIAGRDVTHLSATRRARGGLARTFQAPRVFEDMSLYENLNIDGGPDGLDAGIRERWDRVSARALTHGQRRLTEVFRVILRHPSVLLLDEPAAGLSASERDELGDVLRRLADSGVAVLLIEHDLSLVWSVAHTVSVMELGQVLRTDTPQALAGDEAIDSLLGGIADAQR